MSKRMPRIVWVAALSLYVLFYTVYSSALQVVVIGAAIIAVFSIYSFFNRGKIQFRMDGYHIYILIFCLFCYTSAIWAQRASYSISKGNLLLQILVAMTVMHLIFADWTDITALLKLIQWGNYIVLGYVIAKYGWSTITNLIQNDSRLSNDFLNANTIGMCAAYAITINVYFILYEKIRLTDILIIPAIIVLAASGSRKALLIALMGIFMLFILKNFDMKKFIKSLLKVFFVVLVLLILILFLLKLPMFENTIGRFNDLFLLMSGGGTSSTSGWIRFQYIKLGLNLFKQNPILGIGIDNAKIYTYSLYGLEHYLHNNYVELLACGGIIGTVIYYSIYVYILGVMIRNISKRDKEWDICIVLLVIRFIIDYGAVSYESRGTYVYLLLFWLMAKKLKSAVHLSSH